jgi:hypothetical protein
MHPNPDRGLKPGKGRSIAIFGRKQPKSRSGIETEINIAKYSVSQVYEVLL